MKLPQRGASTASFEWDPVKEALNREKHGIRFSDAVAVFEDEAALSFEDPDAQGERRFVVTGLDAVGRQVTVVYTHRDDRIRLISARRASARERQSYES